ncbi:MAG: helix-turn-helix transcriptional regulator [Mycobacteriales bacterium]
MLYGMDREEFADFLRRRRAKIRPEDAGLAVGRRRRAPGLRREEVAQLAGISVDYLARLEQARGSRPSGQVLSSLARALRLTDDERDHLFHLVGLPAPYRLPSDGHVRPGLLIVLDRLVDTPAQVVTAFGDILTRNGMATALYGDISGLPSQSRNLLWRWFTEPGARGMFPPEEWDALGRAHVSDLRIAAGRRPKHPRAGMIALLLARSPEFAALWRDHDVAARHSSTKTILHPQVGRLELDCEALRSPEHEQILIVYTARPGSESQRRLELLRVLGTQSFAPTEA